MQKIELKAFRDFGALFNDAIKFLTKNSKSFFGSILMLAGPFVLLTGILFGVLIRFFFTVQNINSTLGHSSPLKFLNSEFFGTSLIMGLILILTALVANATVYIYFKLYLEIQESDLPVKRKNISPLLTRASLRLLGNYMLLALVSVGIFAVLAGVALLLGVKDNQILGIVLLIIFIVILLLLFPLLGYLISAALYLSAKDNQSIFVALKRVLTYMRGNVLWTWVYMVCVSIMVGTINYIFMIPLYILTFVLTLTTNDTSSAGILTVSFVSLSMAGSLLFTNPILQTFIIFNFHSHEEKHEGSTLLIKIENIS